MIITTPTILVDLLKSNKINFKRLCHLILEDGTKILIKDNHLMEKIWHLLDNVLENRKFSKSLQLIICAEHWSRRLTNLLKNLETLPMVCIGNYLEAALYGGMEFSVHFVDSSCKDQEMISAVFSIIEYV